MISRLTDSNKGIGTIQSEENEEIQYCPFCSEFHNKLRRLGPLIILDPSKPLPPDYDDFKQCGWCYAKIPIYDVRTEGKLFTDLEPIKNPFEFGNVDSEGVHNKGLRNQMKEISKKTKQEPYAKDKEVMKEARDGAVITGYFTDA